MIENGKFPVFQNSLVPMGYFNNYNRNARNTYVISAGAAGEIGYSNVNFWAADDCFTFECNELLENKYLYYYLLTKREYLFSRVRKASIPRLSKNVIIGMIIPLPPLEEQNRIVEVLDRFDKLCNDISNSLPAEVEARQKQYEYYRDKLLTFKQLDK